MRPCTWLGLWLALPLAAVAAADSPVVLYYWGSEDDVMALDMIDDFETLHGGAIEVIMGQSASINKTSDPQRLLCGVAGGDPPDVVRFDRYAVGEWAAKGAFMPLQAFLERDLRERPDDPLTLHPEDFYPPCWQEANYDGQLYGVPTRTDNRALYYNIDLLERHREALIAAGCVDPNDPTKPGPPRTWKQLKAAAQILTEYDENGGLVRVGFIPDYGDSRLYIYGWLNGGKFMSDDGRTCTLNAPEIVEALAFVTEMYDMMGGVKRVNAFQTSEEGGDLDPFLAGKVAMRIDTDSQVALIANARRDLRFGVCPPPAPEGKPSLAWCGGWSLVIPTGAKHPDEAWEYIKYMVSRRASKIKYDANQQRARATGNIWMPRIHARVDICRWAMEHYVYSDPEIDPKLKAAKRIFVDTMPTSKYRPVTPVGQLLWNEHVRAMEDGLYKRFDSEDVVRNAQRSLDVHTAEVQRELDRIFKPVDYPVLSWKPVVAAYVALLMAGVVAVYVYFGRKVRAKGYFRHEFRAGYLFAAPWFLGFLVFSGGPILFSLFMSFCQYDVFSPPKWVGLKNYIDMFANDPVFYKSLWNTVYMAIAIPLGMGVSLGIAMLLSHEIKGIAVYRTFFYLPAIMPAVAASILWRWMLHPEEGVLNALIEKVGLPGPLWLQDEHTAKPALILMGLWGAGSGMIVWLAGLKGIPKHLYEAADIDGAGRLRKFWNVTMPMLSPYILFNLIMGLIGTFQIFTKAYIMTQGGPVDSTLFYAYNLFNNAFRYMRMGYASALAWLLFFIVVILTLIQLRLSQKWVHYESGT